MVEVNEEIADAFCASDGDVGGRVRGQGLRIRRVVVSIRHRKERADTHRELVDALGLAGLPCARRIAFCRISCWPVSKEQESMQMKNGRAWLCLSALAVLLAGCAAPPKDRPLTSEVPEPPSFAPPPETCQAAAARFGLGLQATQALLQEMMQRAGARTGRTVPATDTASPAQDPTRLNLQVEPNGRIVGAYCG